MTKSTSMDELKKVMDKSMRTHGVPDEVWSDGGPPYNQTETILGVRASWRLGRFFQPGRFAKFLDLNKVLLRGSDLRQFCLKDDIRTSVRGRISRDYACC